MSGLTKKEKSILRVLWDAGKPLTVTEICENARKAHIDLNQSTVQVTVKKMMQNDILKVGEITQVNKVLARAYQPVMNEDEFAAFQMKNIWNSRKQKGSSNFMAALLQHEVLDNADINELAAMIEELRKK